MIKYEFKKLLFKQYGLILIIIVVIFKAVSSADLFKPDYGSLSPQQQEIYINYINELGGVLTEEKEAVILEKYSLLLEAKAQQSEIQNKLSAGEFASTEEYFEALSKVPAIVSEKDAIEKLYIGYESVAKNRENRVLLASDACAMTVGQEYWLLIFICYISAFSIYYERKINNLQKTSVNGTRGYCAKLLAIFTVIWAVWLIFAVIEFLGLTAVVSGDNLSASLASLETFKECPYSDMTILGGFCCIQLVKLIGYLFTAAVTLILIRLSGNLILSIFSPVALNVVWIYLFSNYTAAFYQPFSLMRGSPYFTGTHYLGTGSGRYPEYEEIPMSALAVLIIIAFVTIVTACAAVLSTGKNRIKIRKLPVIAGLTVLTMLLGGCSGTGASQASEGFGSAGELAKGDDKYYVIQYITDQSNGVRSCNIAMLDSDLNVTESKIIRNIFDSGFLIDGIYEYGGCLYYSAEFNDGSRINRINLTDFSEETVFFGDYAPFMGQTKYFDMITVWHKGDRDDVQVKNFFVSDRKIVLSMWNNNVYSLDIATGVMTYLFEDTEVNNLCTADEKIFYLNMRGELICFENNEKHIVSSRIFGGICSDGKYVYGCGTSGVYSYDSDLNESELSKTKGENRISAYNGKVAFETKSDWVYIDKDGERTVEGADVVKDEVIVCDKGLILSKHGMLSLYEGGFK